jgi:hypothetical protein
MRRYSESDNISNHFNIKLMNIKKINIYLVGISIISICLLNSCSTLFSGTKEKVQVMTSPTGARVFVNGKDQNVITPCEIKVPRKKQVTYTFQKTGYEDGSVKQEGSFNAMVVGNILLGGIPGAVIDYASGAWYKLPKNVSYIFEQAVPANDPTIRAGEANNMVSREKPGSTALERTIVRWNFDSDPRGSRIFWRVISSIPDQVKNTNETYMTTTPYEETRSFNILGLTYENSRDVTIEIKVSKRGYHDQVKRYNVRQAIDQQEISGFFELVKADE